MMKYTKKVSALVGAAVVVIMFFVGVPLHTMISEKSTAKHLRLRTHPVQQTQSERYKNKLIWVRTSDNVRMKLPQWQIDQMKAVQHKGEGTKYHWIDAPMITSDELELVQKALNVANNLEQFRKFYASLLEDQKGILINSASKLEMQGLTSLLMAYFFPMNVQEQIGATIAQVDSVIAPVVEYLKEKNQKKILEGHEDRIICVAYSFDGHYIVSGSGDSNLILWNGKTGEQIKVLKGHAGPVRCVAYSPDGNYIVSGSQDETLILWNGKTGERIKILQGHTGDVNCIAYSLDGNYIVSGSNDWDLILWNGKTGEKIEILKGHKFLVSCVAYSPDGNYIVSGSWDKNLILWNGKTGEQTNVLKGHKGIVKCVAYSLDSNYIVSGSNDKDLILWDGKTGKQIKILKGHKAVVQCIAYSPDGNYIVSGALAYDNNSILILWNGKTGEQIKILKGDIGTVECVAYSPDGNYIVSGTSDFNLILWDGKTGEQIKIFKGHKGSITCVAYSPDDNYIVSGSYDKNLILWKLIDQKVIDYIATQLNIAQARLLYRLYMAQKNNVPMVLDIQDADYQIYLSLPEDVQHVIKSFLPFELASDIVEKQIQEKMNEHRSKFKKMAATNADKIKTLKILMKDLDKYSVDYKACERLLREIELEEAFEV
jgi:WD40 repeat protein